MSAAERVAGAAPPARAPRPPLLRPRRSRDRRRRLRRAARRAARARGRAPRARHARLADPARRRRRRSRSSRRSPTCSRCCRSPTCARPRSCARWIARMRSHLAREGIEDAAFTLRRRAEDRRPGDLAASTATACWSAARRAATARSARTSRTTCARSRRSRCGSTTRRRSSRCAARSTCRCRTSRRSTSGARSQGLSTFMNPRNSAAGTIRQLDPALAAERPLSHVVLRHRRDGGAALRAATGRALEWLRAHGFRVNGDVRRLDDRGRGRRAVPRLAGAARRARLRDRRRRRQGRRPRAAAAARRRRARPALGGRVEVPADDGGDAPAPRRSGTSASSATCTRSPSSSRSRSAASPSSWRRCTTRRTWRARTSAPATT